MALLTKCSGICAITWKLERKPLNWLLHRFYGALSIFKLLNASSMSTLSKDTLAFFKDLAANNNRDWFLENKKRYENSVKKPFAAFVAEMIERARTEDPEIAIEPKHAIFRINRDIRFSKDKTPYKTNTSALVSRGGRKDHSRPALYMELSADHIRVYSGAYMPGKEQLYTIREHIAANLDAFDKLTKDKTFKKHFGEIRGEKNKRLPKEFMEAAEQQPLMYNKGFYWFSTIDPKEITNPKLADLVWERYASCKPMRDFFLEAMDGVE